ncbi:MAG: hypothetical protein HKL95_10395 [Phycisphaerae bacterium]|nr:hypothetical protein [Phycisphaerae bacterium]
MDQALRDLLAQAMDKSGKDSVEMLVSHDENSGPTVRVTIDGQTHTHVLKPLAELYGKGVEAPTLDPASPEYMPLCLAIEESILSCERETPDLTDTRVLLALERLAIKPEADTHPDDVASDIQNALRMCLSLENYSRRDVQRALRKIAKSVQRHTRADGPYGYLRFIAKVFSTSRSFFRT